MEQVTVKKIYFLLGAVNNSIFIIGVLRYCAANYILIPRVQGCGIILTIIHVNNLSYIGIPIKIIVLLFFHFLPWNELRDNSAGKQTYIQAKIPSLRTLQTTNVQTKRFRYISRKIQFSRDIRSSEENLFNHILFRAINETIRETEALIAS